MLKFIIIFFGCLYLIGCSCSGHNNRTDSEYVLDMIQQKNIKAQEGKEDGSSWMRTPPEGTRARNRSYYPYKDEPLKAEKNLKNPLKFNREIIAEGRVYYERFCIYCHGENGEAKVGATVASKLVVAPPSLLSDKAKGYSDGRLYHIIYSGQGLMGSYRAQLETKEQVLVNYMNKKQKYRGSKNIWSVVHYLRSLQKKSQLNKRSVK